jgi:hypothetical protein
MPRQTESLSPISDLNPKSKIQNQHGGVAQRKSKGLINLGPEVRIFPPQPLLNFRFWILDFGLCLVAPMPRQTESLSPISDLNPKSKIQNRTGG